MCPLSLFLVFLGIVSTDNAEKTAWAAIKINSDLGVFKHEMGRFAGLARPAQEPATSRGEISR